MLRLTHRVTKLHRGWKLQPYPTCQLQCRSATSQHADTSPPQPPASSRRGGVFWKLVGLSVAAVGGAVGYAWCDSKFRETVEDNVPYLKNVFDFILPPLSAAPASTDEKPKTVDSSESAASEGVVRVKFATKWHGSSSDYLAAHPRLQDIYTSVASELAEALELMEITGVTPVFPDGKVAGNAAARIVKDGFDFLVVSKSGKVGGRRIDIKEDFCIVTSFDEKSWCAHYYSESSSTLPTSDTPLHMVALHAAEQFRWSESPTVSLHGHALETEEAANRLHIPCSKEETLFSTPADSQALQQLLKDYPYPEDKIFVRKGHGFLILGKTTAETVKTFQDQIVPFI